MRFQPWSGTGLTESRLTESFDGCRRGARASDLVLFSRAGRRRGACTGVVS